MICECAEFSTTVKSASGGFSPGKAPFQESSFSHQAGEVADRVIKLPTFSIPGCAIEFYRSHAPDVRVIG